MLSKQKTGRLIMGNHFGYIKDPNDKTKLLVDINVKHIIQEIFELYAHHNYGIQKIAKEMNSRGYPTPSKYYYSRHLERGRVYGHKVQPIWTTNMISNILKNEIYTGTLITRKKQTVGIRGKAKKLPKEDNFIFENHHEAIISKELFNAAHKIRKSKKNKISVTKQRDYFFKGFVKCGECDGIASGKTIRRARGRIKGYCCSKYISHGLQGCTAAEIPEEVILVHFKTFLENILVEYKDVIHTIEMKTFENKKQDLESVLLDKKQSLEEELKMLISERIKDLVSTDDTTRELVTKTYKELEEGKKQEIIEIIKKLEEVRLVNTNKVKRHLVNAIDYYEEILTLDAPPYYLTEQILENVYIYRDKSIRFELKTDIDMLCS